VQERIFQCAACGTRVLRSRPIDRGERCPRCGRTGQLEPFGGLQPGRPAADRDWVKQMLETIEGGRGPLRWR
jgi:hypothetical protein